MDIPPFKLELDNKERPNSIQNKKNTYLEFNTEVNRNEEVRDMAIKEKKSYDKFFEGIEIIEKNNKTNPSSKEESVIDTKNTKACIEKIRNYTEQHLSEHLSRYNPLPPTSQAYFYFNDERIIYASNEILVAREAKNGGKEIQRCLGSLAPITAIALSKGEKFVAVSNKRGDILIFDINNSELIESYKQVHNGKIFSIDFFPDEDRKCVVSGSKDSKVKLSESKKSVSLEVNHEGAVRSVAFSKDGKFVISGGSDGKVIVYDIAKKTIAKLISNNDDGIRSVALASLRDKHYLLTGGKDKKMKIYNFNNPYECYEIYKFSEAKDKIYSVAISPDLKKVASGSKDKQLIIYYLDIPNFAVPTEIMKSEIKHVAFSSSSKDVLCVSKFNALKVFDSNEELKFNLELIGIRSLAIKHDGRFLFSGEDNGKLKIYDMESTNNLWEKSFKNDLEKILAISVSPKGDKLVLGGQNGNVLLIIINTSHHNYMHEYSQNVLQHHKKSVRTVAFAPDGEYYATGGDDNKVYIISIKIKQTASHPDLEPRHTDGVCAVVFSPNGKYLASGSSDKNLKLWEKVWEENSKKFEWKEKYSTQAHSDTVRSVDFSQDSRWILTGSFDQKVKLFDVENLKELRVFEGHTESVTSVAISPDKKFVASGGIDKRVLLFCADTGKILQIFSNNTKEVRGVVFHPDGSNIFTGSLDGQLKIYKIASKEKNIKFARHSDAIRALAISHDGEKVASGGNDKKIKIFSVRTSRELLSLQIHEELVTCLSFSPNGHHLASGSEDQTVKISNIFSGTCIYLIRGHTEWVTSLSYSSSGRYLLSTSASRCIILFDCKTGRESEPNIAEEEKSNYRAITFKKPEDEEFFVAGDDKIIRKYNVKGKKLNEKQVSSITYEGHKDTIYSIACSNDGKYLASGSEDKTVRIYNINKGDLVWSFIGHLKSVNSVAISPNSQNVLSGGDDSKMFMVNIETGILLKIFPDQEGAVNCVAFHPDGKRVVSAGDSNTACFYEIDTKKELSFSRSSEKVREILFSNDGNLVALFLEINLFRVFNVQKGRFILQIEEEEDGFPENTVMGFLSINNELALSYPDNKIKIFQTNHESENSSEPVINPKPGYEIVYSKKGRTLRKLGSFITCSSKEGHFIIAVDKDSMKLKVFSVQLKEKEYTCSLSYSCKSKEIKESILSLWHLWDVPGNGGILIMTTFVITNEGMIYKCDFKTREFKKIRKLPLKDKLDDGNTSLKIFISPDKKRLATVKLKHRIAIYQIESGSEDFSIPIVTFLSKNAVGFLNNDKFIISSDENCLHVFDLDLGCEVQRINTEENIESLGLSERIDTIALGLESGGVKCLFSALNQPRFSNSIRDFCDRKIESLEKRSIRDIDSFEIDVLPYPLKFSRLHYWIITNEAQIKLIIDIIEKILKNHNSETSSMMEKLLFLDDFCNFSPWDYLYSTYKRLRDKGILRGLISIITSKKIQDINKMKDKSSFLGEVLTYFPSKLNIVLDSFLLIQSEVAIRLPKTTMQDIIVSEIPNPLPEYLNQLFDESRYPSQKKIDMITEVKITQMTPDDINNLLVYFVIHSESHPLYKSECLELLVEHIWQKETKKIVIFAGLFHLFFITILCFNFFWFFPKRSSSKERSSIQDFKIASLVANIIIISILTFQLIGKTLIKGLNKNKNQSKSKIKKYSILIDRDSLLEHIHRPSFFQGLRIRTNELLKNVRFESVLKFIYYSTGMTSLIMDSIWAMNEENFESNFPFKNAVRFMFSIFFLVSWIYTLNYALCFKLFSIVIQSIYRILNGMMGFIVVAFFLFIGASLATFLLQFNYDHFDVWEFFQSYFFLVLGDYYKYWAIENSTSVDVNIYFIILVVFSVLIVFVLLDLLIAIVADSYEKVMTRNRSTDIYQKLLFITKIKKMLSIENEQKQNKDFQVYICKIAREEQLETDKFEEKITTKIDRIEAHQKEQEKMIIKILQLIKGVNGNQKNADLFLEKLEKQNDEKDKMLNTIQMQLKQIQEHILPKDK